MTPEGDGWSGKVDQLFVESDRNGKLLAKLADPGEFHITPNTRSQFDRIGAAYVVEVPLKENAAVLQVFVRDIASGRIRIEDRYAGDHEYRRRSGDAVRLPMGETVSGIGVTSVGI